MHQMIRSQGLRRFLIKEAPGGLAALVIAELFYKFQSFLLECIAFLATWFVLSFLLDTVMRAVKPDEGGMDTKGGEVR